MGSVKGVFEIILKSEFLLLFLLGEIALNDVRDYCGTKK